MTERNQEEIRNEELANEVEGQEVEGQEVVDNNEQQTEATGLASLFQAVPKTSILGGANQLNKTAKLTQVSEDLARLMMNRLDANIDEYSSKVLASQQSHDAMDDLINELQDLGSININFLETEDEESLEKMIRSQQSKRSRAKSKVMTRENYMTMMVGAIAENLLRLAAGKPKSSGGGAVMGDIGFSAEDLEQMAQFPDELKKAIRNVQSKKSIMKSKADFDPQSARWQQLLRAEQQLKEVRDRENAAANQEAKEAIQAKKALEERLGDIDIENLKPEDAKAVLDQIREMMLSK